MPSRMMGLACVLRGASGGVDERRVPDTTIKVPERRPRNEAPMVNARGNTMKPATVPATPAPAVHRKFYRHLYFQVLLAIAAGILLGHFYPTLATDLKP
ncbi:MAG: hypothetical protein B7Y12_14545, partial [Rhizobiales bacterium 24-66-13]